MDTNKTPDTYEFMGNHRRVYEADTPLDTLSLEVNKTLRQRAQVGKVGRWSRKSLARLQQERKKPLRP